jgi:hypothetical protein
MRDAYNILVGKPEEKRPLGRRRCRWVDNIRMDLREMGWDAFPAGTVMDFFPLHHRFQIGSGANPASYPMGTGASCPGGKVDQSPPSSAEVKNAWSYTSIPQMS